MAKQKLIRIATDEEVLRFGREHYDEAPSLDDINRFLKKRKIKLGRLTDILLNLWIKPEDVTKTHEFEYCTLIYADGNIRTTGWIPNYIDSFSALVSFVDDYLRMNTKRPTALTYPEAYHTVSRIFACKAREQGLDYTIESIEAGK